MKIGAPSQNSIELNIGEEILSELEDWSADISRDPMVLRELEKVDQDAETDHQDQTTLKPNSVMRGPRP